MIKNLLVFGCSILCWMLLSGWGYIGHKKIAKGASTYFDPNMSVFHEWTEYIVNHSADPDKRKSNDKTEGAKHYIDVDNYAEFIENGAISQNLDTIISRYGSSFVVSQGYLPWATLRSYDSLVSCFFRNDFEQAKFFTADLSHYVADGHMPMHITRNYDGQYSGNDGIHSRYESKMINPYVDSIVFTGGQVQQIENVPDYIFNYIYHSFSFIDTILHADDYAQLKVGSSQSTAYIDTLWLKTKDVTQLLFEGASKSLAELLYSAWVKAGSPDINHNTSADGLNTTDFSIDEIIYYSSDSTLELVYQLEKNMAVEMKITNIQGKTVWSSNTENINKGPHRLSVNDLNADSGIYIFSLKGNGRSAVQKFLVN